MSKEADYQVWLGLPGCSMRGVRYRQMTPDEVDSANVDAAVEGGKDMTLIGYQQAASNVGAKRMIVAYTEPLAATDKEPDLDDPKLAWTLTDPLKVETQTLAMGGVFNAKDCAILTRVYSRLHEAVAAEVGAIMGKARRPKRA